MIFLYHLNISFLTLNRFKLFSTKYILCHIFQLNILIITLVLIINRLSEYFVKTAEFD